MRVFPMVALTLTTLSSWMGWAGAIAAETRNFGPDSELYQATVDRAVRFLASNQASDGSLSSHVGIGPTALATLGLLRSGGSPTDPQIAKSLEYLEEYTQESGGIYAPGSRISVYETCIALVCFAKANRDGRYDEMLKHADKFLRDGQWDEDRGKEMGDRSWEIGHCGKGRCDAEGMC